LMLARVIECGARSALLTHRLLSTSTAAATTRQRVAEVEVKKAEKVDGEDEEETARLLGDTTVGRARLLGLPLWEQYSRRVRERMENPRHRGEITRAEADALGCDLFVADHGAESCGDAVRMFWAVDRTTGRIRLARFQTFGCATAIAASDITAELCLGKTPAEAAQTVDNRAVERALRDTPERPAVPPQKMHCSVMAHDVVKKAAAALCSSKGQQQQASSSEDDEVVCRCAGVSLGTIRRAIRLNNLSTVAEVTAFTKAGAFCGSCVKPGGHDALKRYIIDILRDELRLRKAGSITTTAAAVTGSRLSGSLARRAAAIQKALDKVVTPALAAHDGNVELIDVTNSGSVTTVHLAYRGACSTCPSAREGTLSFVRDALRKELADPTLEVAIAD